MQELVQHLQENAGLTEEQAIKAIDAIKGYLQSKLPPMFSGMVDNFLGSNAEPEDHLG